MAPRRSARVSAAAALKATEKETYKTEETKETYRIEEKKKKKKTTTTTTTTRGITKAKAEPKRKTTKTKTQKKTTVTVIASTPPPPSLPPPATPATPRTTSGNNNLDRPVDPHRTAAPLLTPRGSHITAYPSTAATAATAGTPTTTVENLLKEAIAHLLSVDARLKPVIDKFPDAPFRPADLAVEIDPFQALVSGIIGQQVSGAAAKSIKNKFISLFSATTEQAGAEAEDGEDEVGDAGLRYRPVPFPSPQQVVSLDLPTLRTAGLSQRKAEYIHGLAEKFVSGELSARMLLTASDEEVLEKLIAVRGLGKWSVEMFLFFGLKRMDVFSTGDLGVQRGMAAFAGRDVGKLKAKGGGKFKYMSEKDMVEIAAPFSPYRSLFMWYMWRWENVDITVMQA
ncbi:DNA-3-methyladenine glycosylase [Nannizzia gypsea CBS 118893]|uniref:DNA-3-methyladenine glycosylase n=1 Tax=Arthroderma gypseum (strain ATCC MYA-4604 / CBS 118893) TaxID=535722 RepID=E5R3G1_ARTGP|nr:DNA-3-methyladenine glycosylase [Nannizzia gypsea CBS 118893]EFQ98760.1 DNA-3-methyladenine glycosylase [Nannizzia gypsea CBS 118893]